MTEKITINNTANTETVVSEVLRNNLFTQTKDAWACTTDLGQLAISLTYEISENEVIFDIWMLNEDLKIITDKILGEIKEVL